MISEKIQSIKRSIPESVTLVAVSKTKPVQDILEAYNGGQRDFGENRVQELMDKHEQLPKDIRWHMIGHLQTNKVKCIAPFVSLIHSVDSLKLLKEINKEAQKNNRIIDCLLQFYIAQEESKFGLTMEEACALLQSPDFKDLKNVRLVGIMGMASFVDDPKKIQLEFRTLNTYFKAIKLDFYNYEPSFKEISMGMSGDYQIAISEGSTMIRVGSSIFN